MEPCLFRHGKGGSASVQNRRTRLQWSHVFSDMVRESFNLTKQGQILLQWSHVFSDMVSQGLGRYRYRIGRASMEPCLFRHGKGLAVGHELRTVSVASMEPCLFRHGKLTYSQMVRYGRIASMEPCLFRHGKEAGDGCVDDRGILASMEPCLFRHGKRLQALAAENPYRGFNGAMSFQTW